MIDKSINKAMAEETAKELEKRVKEFNAEFLPLLAKHKLGLSAVAFLLPDGRIAARPQLFDDSKRPTPTGQNMIDKNGIVSNGEITEG